MHGCVLKKYELAHDFFTSSLLFLEVGPSFSLCVCRLNTGVQVIMAGKMQQTGFQQTVGE